MRSFGNFLNTTDVLFCRFLLVLQHPQYFFLSLELPFEFIKYFLWIFFLFFFAFGHFLVYDFFLTVH